MLLLFWRFGHYCITHSKVLVSNIQIFCENVALVRQVDQQPSSISVKWEINSLNRCECWNIPGVKSHENKSAGAITLACTWLSYLIIIDYIGVAYEVKCCQNLYMMFQILYIRLDRANKSLAVFNTVDTPLNMLIYIHLLMLPIYVPNYAFAFLVIQSHVKKLSHCPMFNRSYWWSITQSLPSTVLCMGT